ncbi:2-dehydro-3-deoxygalactonokinase [Phaeobacter sp. QD34_3]|uniref:2-dehydro-3-deoxygalactonokinase n=1 Tax=unclassified Phaeobacter TaxID=2621772 RepID=UPI00237FCB26|nr:MULTISPECIES: 2-dehydro-3-deoxygalactonokinase [unclassified Phaeobacter]MDE4131491.1 2-dehydro-3-deoxygalactonokinase [Phaeobacter sp. QD34_3]MDE4135420.1 2-dehydro-3-deoxygalactonokinase [Phaeobacter sp. QD34_24]MDE4175521.1 2-dehydro-3-deoxygalactonokinase [Phaeobacter sp. PT47_59]
MSRQDKPLDRPETWIAADLQGATCRLWAMSGRSIKARNQVTLPGGIADPALAETYVDLCHMLGARADLPLIACGSALTPPQPVPARPDHLSPASVHDSAAMALPQEASLYVTPGLIQKSPPAAMQGAETRIRGFLSLNPGWDGVLCLPGETTHWALISADEVVSFQSFLTVGLVEATLQMLGLKDADWSSQRFNDSLADTLSRPELTGARLAEAKAAFTVATHLAADSAGQIWGALLGAELAAARAYWLGQNLAVIGSDRFLRPYETALRTQAIPVTVADEERMTVAGLTEAWRQMAG